ncbi:MAG: ECF-type sigma factor [Candidatus Eisenbacteria bacterium]|uniref:Sigma-70 family RNA polymerase sigma factor n=1 Tax=Eiseniibacteriota bacterium TaxID=2212470 RepID=A0A956LWP9_UNCEI|nr:sigma-70 family RNA polymerase sigma factor [Candidatus Eisenbacteria bacterium]
MVYEEHNAEEYYPVFYAELREIARRYMSRERTDHTLQPTALVHEAYLRLQDRSDLEIQDDAHVRAIAARAMRNVLIDHARGHNREKRGGRAVHVTLGAADGTELENTDPIDILQLENALDRLRESEPRKAQVVDLLYFGGMKVPEVAEALGVTRRTIERDWTYARLWLLRQMEKQEPSDS